MNWIIPFIIAIVESALLGSIPCGVLVGHAFGADPREGGSGSIGATNVNRTLGWQAGLITFVLDVAKGLAASFLGRLILFLFAVPVGWQADLVLASCALFAILGHMFTPWLHFKGGKGISVGLGGLLGASWTVALTALAFFLVFALITRMVSFGSIASGFGTFVGALIFHTQSAPWLIIAALICVAVVWAHRQNIVRIAHGEESTFSLNRSSSKKDADDPKGDDEA